MSTARYAGITTKVKSLISHLLSPDDYLKMIEAQTTDQVLDYLVNRSVYGRELEGDDVNLSDIEWRMKAYLFEKYEQLVHYVTDEDRRLFKALFIRYEIENIKVIMRMLHRHEVIKADQLQMIHSKFFALQDFGILEGIKSIPEFLDLLKHTDYPLLLRPFVNEPGERMLFYMEMVLDGYYFKHLYQRIQELKGSGKVFMETLLGTNVDFLNLQWIYRGLKFYKLTPEELFNYALVGGKVYPLKKLKPLCYLNNVDDMSQHLIGSLYHNAFANLDQVDVVMEREMERAMYHLFKSLSKDHGLSIIAPIAYLHQLEYEIRDVSAIIEAKRYGLNADQTKAFLVICQT